MKEFFTLRLHVRIRSVPGPVLGGADGFLEDRAGGGGEIGHFSLLHPDGGPKGRKVGVLMERGHASAGQSWENDPGGREHGGLNVRRED